MDRPTRLGIALSLIAVAVEVLLWTLTGLDVNVPDLVLYLVGALAVFIILATAGWYFFGGNQAPAPEDLGPAFETSDVGETYVEGGSVTGYPTVSKTTDRGRTWLRWVNVKRR